MMLSQVRSIVQLASDRDLARFDDLAIDAAIAMPEAAHQRLRDGKVARASVGIDIGGRTTHDPLHDFQPRALADGDLLPEQVELVPGRPALHIDVAAETQRVHRQPDGGLNCGHGSEIDDRNDLARDIGEAVTRRVQDLRRSPQLIRAELREELLDAVPAIARAQVTLHGRAAVEFDGQRMARVIKAGAQRRQALVAHQHEIARLRLMARRLWIKARGPVLDGVEPVTWHRLARRQGCAGKWLRRKAFHRIAVDRINFGGTQHDHDLILPSKDLQGCATYYAARRVTLPIQGRFRAHHQEPAGSAHIDGGQRYE